MKTLTFLSFPPCIPPRAKALCLEKGHGYNPTLGAAADKHMEVNSAFCSINLCSTFVAPSRNADRKTAWPGEPGSAAGGSHQGRAASASRASWALDTRLLRSCQLCLSPEHLQDASIPLLCKASFVAVPCSFSLCSMFLHIAGDTQPLAVGANR